MSKRIEPMDPLELERAVRSIQKQQEARGAALILMNKQGLIEVVASGDEDNKAFDGRLQLGHTLLKTAIAMIEGAGEPRGRNGMVIDEDNEQGTIGGRP